MVEMKNNSTPSFNTRWDETIIAMKKQLDDGVHLSHHRQLTITDKLLSIILVKMRIANRKLVRSISPRERQLEKPASGAAAAKGKSKGKGKRNRRETACSGQYKVSALEEIRVA